MSRIPTLGPRGEGWVALQSILLVAIPFAAWQAALNERTGGADLDIVRRIGGLVLIAALVVIGVSIWWLQRSRALSALPRPIETGALVQTGPYRFVRHPIYSGLVLAGAAVALIRLSLVIAVLTLLLTVVLDLKRRREETWLEERYDGYAAYRSRTKALVPFLY